MSRIFLGKIPGVGFAPGLLFWYFSGMESRNRRKGQEGALRKMSQREWQETLAHLNRTLEQPYLEGDQQAWLLFWMGAVLDRLCRKTAALRCWHLAVSLSEATPAARMIRQKTNGYGMPRQETAEMDDWRAFLAIQANRYLRTRGGRFGSSAERDMVSDLIADGWIELRKQADLSRMGIEEKKRLFRRIRLAFPFLSLQALWDNGPGAAAAESREIPINFQSKRVMGPQELCSCGSGLPYSRCCGRVSWPFPAI